MTNRKKTERVGIFPGSFDPVTLGHLDLIRRSAALVDRLVVGVLVNYAKKSLFSPEERVKMIQIITADIPNVEVVTFSGLTVDYCREHGITVMFRGVRGMADMEYEMQLAQNNRMLYPEAETVFLAADSRYASVSSSGAKELAVFGSRVELFLPPEIVPLMKEKYADQYKDQEERIDS